MQLRIPWILSRKRLLAATFLDAILFALLYYFLYEWHFGVMPGVSLFLALLLVIWSLSSYVAGRYSGWSETSHKGDLWVLIGNQLIATAFVSSLTIGFVLFHIFIFRSNPAQASLRSFLIPYLVLLAVLSPLFQLALRRLMALQEQDQSSVWFYVGSSRGYQQLKAMSKLSRVKVDIKQALPHNLNQPFSTQYIVDHFHDQPSHLLENLYQSQKQGSVVLNRLSWCESVYKDFRLNSLWCRSFGRLFLLYKWNFSESFKTARRYSCCLRPINHNEPADSYLCTSYQTHR